MRRTQTIRRHILIAGLTAVLVALAAAPAAPAAATPTADRRAEAVRIKQQLDRLDAKLEAATEDYDQARVRYAQANTRVARNKSRLASLSGRISVLQDSLDARAEGMYRSGPLGALDVLLGVATFEDFTQTWDLLNKWNREEADAVAELRASRAEAQGVEADLESAKALAAGQLKVVTDRKRYIEAELAGRARLLRGVEGEIAALEAEQRARELARARDSQPSGGWDWGSPTRSPRSGVVSIAMRYLGRPYHWGSAGPDSFDCSGFTMFVYAQVGVSLPHSSRAQFSVGEHVSRANLQPGDLVFFGSPIHHVGLYIGGGRMIHAPNTGDVVSIDSIDRGNYVGATRP